METAKRIIKTLRAAGFEAYIVGGAVRDSLLGLAPHDVDVATSALPDEVKGLFGRTVDTGIAHGTVLVLLDGDGVEVTTFRTEGTYSDNRHPDSVEFVRSLEEDLRRRDFTINAMAMTEEMELVDPFGGREDLEKKQIRAVGNAEERFSEDALRMLRAIRFSSQLDFGIHEETFEAIRKTAPLIAAVSIERVKIEIDKIFLHEKANRSMSRFHSSGLPDHLPAGGLFGIGWEEFTPHETPLYGWAFMLHENEAQVADVRPYKLSNDEKRLLEKVLEAARTKEWDAWTFYSFSGLALEMAARLTGKKVDIQQEKNRLPIKEKRALAIDGKDLIGWTGDRQGAWLKEWIGRIERLVIFGKLPNDKQRIRNWFEQEYRKEIRGNK